MKRKQRELLEKQNELIEQLIRVQVLIAIQEQNKFQEILNAIKNWHQDDTKYHNKTFNKLDAVRDYRRVGTPKQMIETF